MRFLEAAAVVAKAGKPMVVKPEYGTDGYAVAECPPPGGRVTGVVMMPEKAKLLVATEYMYAA